MQTKKKRFLQLLLTLFCLSLFAAVTVSAAPKYRNKFVKTNGKVYHYNEKGKKDTGLIKVNNKTYYFDSKGIQRTGWQKIKNNYYFFQIRNGRGGSMVTSKTVNGIKLNKKGQARYNSAGLRKLKLMVKANKIVQGITHCDMSRYEKLKKCFDKALAYRYYNIGDFRSYDSAWDIYYAEHMIYKGYGDCYCGGAAFAFLANAAGYTNVYTISSGGHGWAEVNGKVYDPNWALMTGHKSTYFGLDYSYSGVNGIPSYRGNDWYRKKV